MDCKVSHHADSSSTTLGLGLSDSRSGAGLGFRTVAACLHGQGAPAMRKIDDVQVQLVGAHGGCYQDASATLVDGLLLDGVIQSDGRKELGRLSSAVVLSGRMRETTGCSYAFDVAMTTTRVLTGSRLNQEIDGCWDSRTLAAAAATPEKGFQVLNKIKERNVACIYMR